MILFIKRWFLPKPKTKLPIYARWLVTDILNVDFSEFREVFANIGRIAGSVNQIAKRVNSTHNVYSEDISEIKQKQEELWGLLKSIQNKLLHK